jgi:protein-S-isoprenylcysteine O-methyltransferase
MVFALDGVAALRLLVVAVATIALVTFALGAAHVVPLFSADHAAERPWRTRGLSLIAALLSGAHIRLVAERATVDLLPLIAALALYLAALAMFAWTRRTVAARLVAPSLAFAARDRLIRTGPYAVVRHPFYAAYLCGWTAAAAATLDPWVVTLAIWLIALYALAGAHEERAFDAVCGDAYASYRLQTGMFLPRVHIDVGAAPRPTAWTDPARGDGPLNMRITAR